MSTVTTRLSTRHAHVEKYLRDRGWTRAREIVDDDIAFPTTVNRLLRDLERLGILEARLIGGGFMQWRHRGAAR